jgi:hypothetical protein
LNILKLEGWIDNNAMEVNLPWKSVQTNSLIKAHPPKQAKQNF